MSVWIPSKQALERLEVRPQTLYAYVSRGLVAARPDPADPRRSLYSGDDIEALRTRRARGRRARQVAQNAIAWGEAVLPTSISTIAHGRLYYRQHDAAVLARAATLEEVAALLWDVEPQSVHAGRVMECDRERGPTTAAMTLLAREAADGMPTLGRSRFALATEAGPLLAGVASALGAETIREGDIAASFATAWRCTGTAAELVRMALVILADHELNASTFATRVAASTGAPLAAALLAGFSTLLGPRHGGVAAQLRAFAADSMRTGATAATTDWMRRGEMLPGFGHRLYQGIDPRAEILLSRFAPPAHLAELAAAVHELAGWRPNVDFALVAMSEAFDLPDDAPFRLFAAGRCCGWLAHAMEQAATGQLIRPRARYDGPPLVPQGGMGTD
ncbi:citrate synthase [Mesorhizobium xinjiangense]|uniref:citrate synthase n=1 Tax=Mesorhizobium xinjiangense TaxID=2678685 RepID=UPI0012EE6ADB|nr:citrate synthase [Mesorhizobium xinjiangense]